MTDSWTSAGRTADSASNGSTTLHGWRLLIARAAWAAVVVLAIGLFIAGLPHDYDDKLTVCAEVECHEERLVPEDAEALRDLGLSERFYAGFMTGLVIVFVSSFTLVAGLVFWRRSSDWMAMLVSLALVSFGTSWPEVQIALAAASPAWRVPVEFVTILGYTSMFLLFYLFPDGRFVPRWTRFPAFAWIVLGIVDFAVFSWGRENPNELLIFLVMPVVFVIGVFTQAYRYTRHSNSVQRQQSKWVAVALTAMVAVIGVGIVLSVTVLSEPGLPRLLGNLVGIPVFFAIPAAVVPGAIGMSILRYRLWDIDVFVNRALVYGLLTAFLAGAYLGIVVGLQAVFRAASGQDSNVAIVISTLLIAALFLPLRRRLQEFIARRFYRRRYDAGRTLASFAATARDEVDLERLSAALVAVVQETMEPAHVSLWLRDAGARPQRSGG